MKLPISMTALKVALIVCVRLVLLTVLLETERTPVQNIILIIRELVVQRYYNPKKYIITVLIIIGRNTKLLNH